MRASNGRVCSPGSKRIPANCGRSTKWKNCSAESPAGRRSLCYDREALAERKEAKPGHSAIGMAEEMGIELLDEAQYRALQKFGEFDLKTSSWLKTPADIRKLGGALFGDRRYGTVFVLQGLLAGVRTHHRRYGIHCINAAHTTRNKVRLHGQARHACPIRRFFPCRCTG